METANKDREFVSLLREICHEQGITLAAFSGDWILRLGAGPQQSYVFGYDFGLNSATARMIGQDKAATSELLIHAGVPAVEHRLFLSPSMGSYIPSDGNWRLMLEYFHANGQDLVCKPNEGTGGNEVFRIRSVPELEAAVHRIFARTRSLSLCAFLPISTEFRIYVLHGVPHVTYMKERPIAVGDGRSSILELILADPFLSPLLSTLSSGIGRSGQPGLDLSFVPAQGEAILLKWHHNLGQGSRPRMLMEHDDRLEELSRLAHAATSALRINLAAVDIVEVDGELLVLEVNCGIMMESFARSSTEHRLVAKRFYEKIVLAALGDPGAAG